MTAQEKLVMELVDEICDWDEYCGDENCNKCGGAIRHWKKKLTALIESAKREELEALKKESYVCTCASGGAGCDDAVFVDDIDNRIAQLKQSEESE